MANLTPQQIAQYAYNAGFRGTDLLYAVAIAIKESAGNTRAYNPEEAAGTRKGSGSRGLWQIYGQAHPEFNNDSVYDPQANAIAAYKVYREAGNKFTPWSTWNNGSAAALARTLKIGQPSRSPQVQAAQQTRQAVAQMSGTFANTSGSAGGTSQPGILQIITQPQATAGVIDNIKNALLGKTEKGQQRDTTDAAAFAIGIILVLIGIIFLFVNSGPGKQAIAAGSTALKGAATVAAL